MTNQVVILCGGRGTRLGDLTKNCPKPLLPVGGRPFLDVVIERFAKFEYKEFVLLAGYKGEQIEKAYREWGTFRGLRIRTRISPPEGTLTTLREAYSCGWLEPEFVLANGDTYPNFDLRDFLRGPGICRIMSGNKPKDSGIRLIDGVNLVNYGGTSIEKHLFPATYVRNLFLNGGFIDIGTPENYERAKEIFR